MSGLIDPDKIAELRIRADLPGLVERAVKLRRAGRGFTACCPFHQERSASFSLYVAPDGGWRFKCHSASCGERGDALDWLTKFENLPFAQAVAVLNGGELPDGRSVKPIDTRAIERRRRAAEKAARQERDKAGQLWRLTTRAAGTVVETYLREARGLARLPAIPACLRLGEMTLWDASGARPREAWTGPAMVAILQDKAGHGIGIHMTFLEPDGSGKLDTRGRGIVDRDGEPLPTKKMRASHMGAAIRLCAPEGPLLAAGEGIETSLSVTCMAPDVPAWAAASLENLAGPAATWAEGAPHPTIEGRRLPSLAPDMERAGFPWRSDTTGHVTDAVLLGDGDTKDLDFLRAKLERGARRAARLGIAARILISDDGIDFNDQLRASPKRIMETA